MGHRLMQCSNILPYTVGFSRAKWKTATYSYRNLWGLKPPPLGKIVGIAREKMAYSGMETVTVKLSNGDQIEVKTWDRERSHSGMDYSVKLIKDSTRMELVVPAEV